MRRLAACAVLGTCFAVSAAPYEVPIYVNDEDDVNALEERGDISATTAQTLRDMLMEPLNLNDATREELFDLPSIDLAQADSILAYRKAKGTINDPAELVGAEIISADQLSQILPFLEVLTAETRLPFSGKIRLQGRYQLQDPSGPPAYLQASVKAPFDLSAGITLVGTRRYPGPLSYDQVTGALKASPPTYRLFAPHWHLTWKDGKRKVMAGTFYVGFAERLVLDTTRRAFPHGIYASSSLYRTIQSSGACYFSDGQPGDAECPNGLANLNVAADYNWRAPFQGIAGSIEDLELGDTQRLSLYGFLSYQPKRLYQYKLFDKRYCTDPRDDFSSGCEAPPIYLASDTSRTLRYAYRTFPDVSTELTGGGRVQLEANSFLRFGVTGYGAATFFFAQPALLDFQEYSSTPFGGPFGSLGADVLAQVGDFSLALEAARSFDSIPGRLGQAAPRGGWAVIQRTTWSVRKHELELTLRFYDTNYVNPYARSVSGFDVVDGQRVRDELGARLVYNGAVDDFRFTGRFNIWSTPSGGGVPATAGQLNLDARASGDFSGWAFLKPGLVFRARNINLGLSQHGQCDATDGYGDADVVYGVTPTDANLRTCDSFTFGARLESNPVGRWLNLQLYGAFALRDDTRYKDRFRNDLTMSLKVRASVAESLSFTGRARWLFQDISDNTYQENSLWGYVGATYALGRAWNITGRYEIYAYLDRRDSTLTRVPNPEHRFFLDTAVTF